MQRAGYHAETAGPSYVLQAAPSSTCRHDSSMPFAQLTLPRWQHSTWYGHSTVLLQIAAWCQTCRSRMLQHILAGLRASSWDRHVTNSHAAQSHEKLRHGTNYMYAVQPFMDAA
mmetsp:Transcript_35914/g.79962  ORF Transcript_35914/g.79962 Transcript_35914/m.79962 type:complete len:114 (-) Transcript_35914:290-631(-)